MTTDDEPFIDVAYMHGQFLRSAEVRVLGDWFACEHRLVPADAIDVAAGSGMVPERAPWS